LQLELQESNAQNSENALSDVEIIEVRDMAERKPKEPLMPSKESAKLDLGEELNWKHDKPATKPPKMSVADVVKKSLSQINSAQDLFKTKQTKTESSK